MHQIQYIGAQGKCGQGARETNGSSQRVKTDPHVCPKGNGVRVSNQGLQLEVHVACCLGQVCWHRYSDSLTCEGDDQAWRPAVLPRHLPGGGHSRFQASRKRRGMPVHSAVWGLTEVMDAKCSVTGYALTLCRCYSRGHNPATESIHQEEPTV